MQGKRTTLFGDASAPRPKTASSSGTADRFHKEDRTFTFDYSFQSLDSTGISHEGILEGEGAGEREREKERDRRERETSRRKLSRNGNALLDFHPNDSREYPTVRQRYCVIAIATKHFQQVT